MPPEGTFVMRAVVSSKRIRFLVLNLPRASGPAATGCSRREP